MASTVTPEQTRRAQIAEYLPAIISFPLLFLWFDGNPFWERLLLASFGAPLLQGIASLGYLAAALIIAKVADTDWSPNDADKHHISAAVLLAIGVAVLGNNWVNKRVDRIAECVTQIEGQPDMMRRGTPAGEIVRWCAYEYEPAYANYRDEY